ncbi:MAG: 1-aminocyclopropane-1-carboxylate deaminase/D-cysteine desulfhydrase [Psychroserpens sp.]|nr:pyridoxal-phosphate dependent enzyme [Psychroserpens sp.]MBO6607990.1 1-aminocyclopropane-1-carboxylate deaminase/D-cysteine desulfhydrase [Psychroserpens sp.]MBO6632651.1 1-aminocyclopropane-1-carboxylate deaminase/D-cysteine desulfhydrase [Psychroserpens sp.]MBO6654883.1 1-aminocyclopropane-1-carboxylate deaminase/D-cysteine desulfhydrase [Psychroserpens sp.]MBO6683043.1 1-aminocyclopropane-1-carboxylate deaminase/D-cysteine desulfhydrase [Psychroserpens sp.]MBO6751348.1 1-aminocyclopropa
MKPEYLSHPYISGNKYRKLKYNLIEAKKTGKQVLLSFGGAYSNHIAAVASAGKEFGFKTIGVIRGEELRSQIANNPTLRFAETCGMTFKFVSRSVYRNKSDDAFIEQLKAEFGEVYILPEGGTNQLAIKGCEEILNISDQAFDYICCPVGTGGTMAGLINSSGKHQKILGFPALKGDFLQEEISKFATSKNWQLILDYHFGGYAKIDDELVAFMNDFKSRYNIQLDPVYTGKMMFGIYDLIAKGYFPVKAKILAIHTGGLQGIAGMNQKLKQQNRPQIV